MVANLWCENCNCGAKGKEKDFQIRVDSEREAKNLLCPKQRSSEHDSFKLKLLGYQTALATHIDKAKHAKGRTPIEKEKRRIEDFKKNTLPKLNNREQKFFNKKFKAKGL